MNIPKAIEIKEEMHSLGLAPYDRKSLEADRLSIEALKRIQFSRDANEAFYKLPLPGETEK